MIAAASMLACAASAQADDEQRISGPYTHQNLSIYFVHGKSAPGPVPLTLQEALEKDAVEVIETQSVNELKVRNKGDTGIYIQSGDIVKGGQQDRVITVSFVLPPNSGEVPLASFCVEQGRWSQRGDENVAQFSSSAEALPSREAKLAMKAPIAAAPQTEGGNTGMEQQVAGGGDQTGERQTKVWEEVSKTQTKLAGGLNSSVQSDESASSLQLSLENEDLQQKRTDYIQALQDHGAEKDDIIGYVFAINGKLNSADLYPSNALFRKMWQKLLTASVTEAIGESGDPTSATIAPPDTAAVETFLADAEKGKSSSQDIEGLAKQDVRDAERSLFVGVQSSDGQWIHRNYLIK
jgi:hypothetical protein